MDAATGSWKGSQWVTARSGMKQASSGSVAQTPVTTQGPQAEYASAVSREARALFQEVADIPNLGYEDTFKVDGSFVSLEHPNFVFGDGK
jgi:hypothetical protein